MVKVRKSEVDKPLRGGTIVKNLGYLDDTNLELRSPKFEPFGSLILKTIDVSPVQALGRV